MEKLEQNDINNVKFINIERYLESDIYPNLSDISSRKSTSKERYKLRKFYKFRTIFRTRYLSYFILYRQEN